MKTQEKNHFGIKFKIISFLILPLAFGIGIFAVAWHSMEQSGNESDAVTIIAAFHQKQRKFASKYSGRFAKTFAELEQFEKDSLEEYADRSDYLFIIKVEEADGIKPDFFSINADPKTYLFIFSKGKRHFYFDSTLKTIKVTEENRSAKADDPSL